MESKKKQGVIKNNKSLNTPPHGSPVKTGTTKTPSSRKKPDKVEEDPKTKDENKRKEVKDQIPVQASTEVAADNPKGDDDYRKTDPDKELLM
ncbi:hypothetical protein [Solitalea canadensis]|uniref:Uncharacterized protein n=1 Tax=Solitalea canadensis (strain ATCC 29591 / DSM 3403 / JCM 21819 / LMG 8368 / NBRC 15130 / NCIMB 12057 / USAM 9D) TaxID=929556 RepID=H8KTN1_SOLCM|nr:hypothetical protein [Solitalea canadensis]AFD06606.1 hypothetical protein Solca_1533 [Solitalea canadensis DSM 3403]